MSNDMSAEVEMSLDVVFVCWFFDQVTNKKVLQIEFFQQHSTKLLQLQLRITTCNYMSILLIVSCFGHLFQQQQQ